MVFLVDYEIFLILFSHSNKDSFLLLSAVNNIFHLQYEEFSFTSLKWMFFQALRTSLKLTLNCRGIMATCFEYL